MDDNLHAQSADTARPAVFSSFFHRMIPAGMPPEVALIGIVLLVWGATHTVNYLILWLRLFFVYSGSWDFMAPMWSDFGWSPPVFLYIRDSIISLIQLSMAIALLKRLRWARYGAIAVFILTFLQTIDHDLRLSSYGYNFYSVRDGGMLIGILAHLASLCFFIGMMVYFLATQQQQKLTPDAVTPSTPFRFLAFVQRFLTAPFSRIYHSSIAVDLVMASFWLLTYEIELVIGGYWRYFYYNDLVMIIISALFLIETVIRCIQGKVNDRPRIVILRLVTFAAFVMIAPRIRDIISDIIRSIMSHTPYFLGTPLSIILTSLSQLLDIIILLFQFCAIAFFLTRSGLSINLFSKVAPVQNSTTN